jgi:hypothetical protein
MICSFFIRIYIVLVNVAHCCQNWMWLLYSRTPVLLCVDGLPCLGFCTHQGWFYGPESKHVLLCWNRIYIAARFSYVPFFSFRELCRSHLYSSRSSLRRLIFVFDAQTEVIQVMGIQKYFWTRQWRNVISGGPRFKIFEGPPLVEVPKARVERRICTSFLGVQQPRSQGFSVRTRSPGNEVGGPGLAHPENFWI